MSVFRRSSGGATESTVPDSEAELSAEAPAKTKSPAQAGKGRPTPKRSEAERSRYQSIQGGTTSGRGAASGGAPARPRTKADKERLRADQARNRDKRAAAMKRGEEWALPPRDRGPLKKLARDYVDAHRRVSEYYMWVLVILLVAMFSQNKSLETYIGPFVFVLVLVIVVDGYLINRALRRLIAIRYPGESTRGLTWYSIMRAMQIRRFRMPAPAVKPGDSF